MDVTAYPILDRRKKGPASVSSVADFSVGAGRTMPAELLLGGGWSPYCVDFARGLAAFVRADEGADLLSAPFLYTAQFEAAEELALMPLADFVQMGRGLPAPERLAVLYSTGRAGSTLASRIFAEMPGVVSLSESDITHGAVFERHRRSEGDLAPVLAAGLAFLGACFAADGRVMVIKPRSELLFVAGAVARAAPGARRAFLYRDVRGYVASAFRFVQRIGHDVTVPFRGEGLLAVWRIASGGEDPAVLYRHLGPKEAIYSEELSNIFWQLRIDAYLAARAAGHDIAPVHYDDLTRDRMIESARLLAATGIDPALAPRAMTAFETDAHRGGATSNEIATVAMDADARARMEAMIARLGCPDLKAGRL